MVEAPGQLLEHHRVRAVQVHADLLIDDALLLADAFLSEIRGIHKVQQQLQAPVKMLGAAKIVGGHVVAGEGVDHGPQGGELRGHVPAPRHIEELVLQVVGGAGGNGVFPAIQGKSVVDGAVVRHQVAQLSGKALPGHHADLQAAGEPFPVYGFVQLRVMENIHWHSPLRK